MQDPAMSRDSGVQVGLVQYTQRQDQVDIEVTLAKNQVFFADAGFVRSNKDLDDFVFNLVAQLVCLALVEGDNKVAQRISRLLDRLLRLQEAHDARHLSTEDR